MSDVTRILNTFEQGDARASDELLPLVYEELRLLAAQKMSQEPPGLTLLVTALVHEAYLRLFAPEAQGWGNSALWSPGRFSYVFGYAVLSTTFGTLTFF